MKKIDALAILSLLCGSSGAVSLELVGNLYLAELLLLPLMLFALLAKGGGGIARLGIFWVLLISGGISLVGYIISDLVVGSESSQYLRGWGRVILLIGNCMALMVLVAHGVRNLWCFVLGWGLGGVITLIGSGVPLSVWKIGYAEPVGMIVVAVCAMMPRSLASLGMLVFGVGNLLLDYRNMGAASVVVAALLWVGSSDVRGQARLAPRYLKPAIMAGVALVVVSAVLSTTDEDFSERRSVSNIGRTAGIVVSLRAIADSPLIGYGSWTQNEEYARLLRKEFSERLGAGNAINMSHGSTFRAHSQILQSWIEGGILGAAFFISFGFALVRALYRLVINASGGKYFAMLSYFMILGAWNLLASPFGGDQRILVAVVAACMAAAMLSSPTGAVATESLSSDRDKSNVVQQKTVRLLRSRAR